MRKLTLKTAIAFGALLLATYCPATVATVVKKGATLAVAARKGAERIVNAEVTVPAGNSVSNSSATNTFTSFHEIPASTAYIGQTWQIDAYGYVSSDATTPGTLIVKVTVGGTQVGITSTMTLPASLSNVGWRLTGTLRVCALGSSGKMAFFGGFQIYGTSVGSGLVNTGTGTAGQITINTTTKVKIQVAETLSSALAANTITMNDCFIVEK